MPGPKLHHYVPQFYLKRFTEKGRLWVFDKNTQKVFSAGPQGIAAQTHFYQTPLLLSTNVDPLFLEKELSGIESAASRITGHWLVTLKSIKPQERVEVSDADRVAMSLYIAVQWLRTTGTQDILELLVNKRKEYPPDQMKNLHHSLLVLEDWMLRELSEKIHKSTWIFGRNTSLAPFVTSDNPVTVHAPNHMWLRWGIVNTRGTCVTLPLSPAFIFFAYEREHWKKVARFDCTLSPVEFTQELVEHENSGQVCNSSRFVISCHNDFEFARDLIKEGYTEIVDPHLRPRPRRH